MDEKNDAEREALKEYLIQNNSSLELVSAELGASPLERMLCGNGKVYSRSSNCSQKQGF